MQVYSKQVIHTALSRELSEIPDARKLIAPIDQAEASKLLAQYLAAGSTHSSQVPEEGKQTGTGIVPLHHDEDSVGNRDWLRSAAVYQHPVVGQFQPHGDPAHLFLKNRQAFPAVQSAV